MAGSIAPLTLRGRSMSASTTKTETLAASALFDLVIIGSGPAALAVITRILESRPAALYTEEEHAHLHWLKRSPRPLLKVKKTGRGQEKVLDGQIDMKQGQCHCDGAMRILVIDRIGGWLANWNRLFKAYEIPHLRSPMFFHPAPFDLNSLVAYAERKGRTNCSSFDASRGDGQGRGRKQKRAEANGTSLNRSCDLVEIPGCVGKEVSKHKKKQERKGKGAWSPSSHTQPFGPAVNERDRRDYFTPSTSLFRDFVQEDLVKRYGLDNGGKPWADAKDALRGGAHEGDDTSGRFTLVRGEVADLSYGDLHIQGWDHMQGFNVKLACGTVAAAKAVVCAMGPGASPNVPAYLQERSIRTEDQTESVRKPVTSGPGWCHSTLLGSAGKDLPPASLLAKEKRGESSTLVVIGGGLTSAQICDVAIRKGISRVVLILRGYIKVKPFDFGLEWIGQYGNLEHMRFWQEDDLEKRREIMFAARNGGSFNSNYAKLIRQYEQQGRLTILKCTTVNSSTWCDGEDSWSLHLTRSKKGTAAAAQPIEEPESIELTADYIVAATGAAPHFSKVPFLSSIAARENVPEYGGLPALSESLQYGSLPLFCTGAFSALQVGPGAFNLWGMRTAADRIAIRLQELAIGGVRPSDDDAEDGQREQDQSNYTHFAFERLLEVEA